MSPQNDELKVELMRANSLLRTVIDENPNIILMKDWNGKFLIGNRALANLYGTTPEQLVGKDDSTFNPNPEQVAFYLQNVRDIMAQSETQVVVEESTNAATGETRYYQSIKKPITTETGDKQILVIANDVTELKKAQSQLEESERRLRYVMEATGEGVWDWDIPSGAVLHNKQWCQIVGLDDGYLQHSIEVFSELLHDEDKVAVFEKIDRCLSGEGQYQSEHRMQMKDGRIVWVQDRGNVVERDAKGTPLRMVGSFVDITERKSIELALGQRTELLNAIFELSPDGFVSFDNAHHVSYVNPAFTRMTEIEPAQLMGKSEEIFSQTLNRICIETTQFKGIGKLRNLAKSSGTNTREVIELGLPDKRILEVILRDSNSSTVSGILYIRDITHESQVDRMKSEFLSTAAHELRTPMASIFGFSEVLLNQKLNVEEQQEFLQTIFKQSKLMVSIINELLDIARIEARRGKDFIFAPIEMTELLQEIRAGFKSADGRVCKCEIDKDCTVWLKADRSKMTQAITNVLSNAFKYSPEGGDVVMEVICPINKKYTEADEPMVGVRIRDQGVGMTEGQIKRIFERFYRADTSGKIPGTGLGMSIVKEIIELHGGKVEVESMYGQGTAVTIWMPYGSKHGLTGGEQ